MLRRKIRGLRGLRGSFFLPLGGRHTRRPREVSTGSGSDYVDGRAFRDLLLKKYGIVVKVGEKRWFNGNRLSPHIFNTEKDIDAAIRAIRAELA